MALHLDWLSEFCQNPCDLSTHVIHFDQCQEHGDLILEDLETVGGPMSHLRRKYGVTLFVENPEVHGEI